MTTTRIHALALAAALGTAVIAPSLVLAHGDGPKGGDRVAHMEQRFAELDADGDGKVTPQEMLAHRAERFAAADANGDGKLSVEEMANARAEQRKMRFGRMIAKLDKDGDGLLSAEEMPDRRDRMMRLDTDGDGAVSLDEMKAAKGRHGAKH